RAAVALDHRPDPGGRGRSAADPAQSGLAVPSQLLEGASPVTSIGRLREVARGKLDQATWKYLESGADDGISIAEAELAWSRLRLRPRILQGVGAAAT